MVEADTFNPSIQEAEEGGSTEFQASLVYRVNSRTAQDRQPNPVRFEKSKKKKKERKEKGRKTRRNLDTECGKELELAQGKVISLWTYQIQTSAQY